MGEDIWTVKRILAWIEEYLAKRDIDNPRLSAQWLVAEALGVSRMQLFLDLDRPLSGEERAALRDFTRRRGTGEPLQYITGTVDFRHITLKVRPGVLIPRPETEVLVSEALALLPVPAKPQDAFDEALARFLVQHAGENGIDFSSGTQGEGEKPDYALAPDASGEEIARVHAPQVEESAQAAASQAAQGGEPSHATAGQGELLVADICTGTGCIACSVAYEHPRTRIIATDIAPKAVTLARENVEALGLAERVEVVECDLASGIDANMFGSFDLVVSNPPYVPTSVMKDVPEEVSSFEPALALDGGPDGLGVFRRILSWCLRALKPGGAFAFELHETCLEQAASEATQAGFTDVRVVRDLADRPRVLVGKWSLLQE